MALTAEEFLHLCKQDLDKVIAHCDACHIGLHEAKTGVRAVANGVLCDDCYFDQLGEVVEAHPIAIPFVRR